MATLDKVCYDIPVVNISNVDVDDLPQCSPASPPWLEPCYPGQWCPFVNTIMETACFEQSILEVWGYDETKIKSLTQEKIISDINKDNLLRKVQEYLFNLVILFLNLNV